ncbi:MAG: prepilin-type N-terminal cleavage/methylation domain-containing protein [Phycisphaerales bacterium JB039]
MADRYTQRGFTLVEVLFSIGVVALLNGLLLVGVSALQRAARRSLEQQSVASLKFGVEHFRDTFGFLPPLVNDGALTGGDPVQDRLVGGVRRPAPVVYDPEQRQAWEFLRGQSSDSYRRYSVYALAYYIVGALVEQVDGIEGPGFYTPLPSGAFRVAGGQRTDPFFDVSKNASGLYTEDADAGRIELRDRNGVAYRYYRWIPGDEAGAVTEVDDLNTPELLGDVREDPQLRAATYAIVAAGPNEVFGEEASEGAAELRLKLGLPSSDPTDKVEAIGRSDNVVEVGQ